MYEDVIPTFDSVMAPTDIDAETSLQRLHCLVHSGTEDRNCWSVILMDMDNREPSSIMVHFGRSPITNSGGFVRGLVLLI